MNNKTQYEPKIIIGGIANGKETQAFFDKLENNTNKNFDEYIILYIDFLGMKDRIMSNKSYDTLQILKFLLYNTEGVTKYICHTNRIRNFNIKVFSDNVIIAQRIDSQTISEQIIGIINVAWSLQFWALLQFGFMMRGGITAGELFIDNDIVWGTGLVEAYQLESNTAVFPRVLVSKEIISLYDNNNNKAINIHAFLNKDQDKMTYVDYLSACPNITSIPIISERLKEITQMYVNSPEKVKQKINWTIRYFNNYCSRFIDRGDYEAFRLELI